MFWLDVESIHKDTEIKRLRTNLIDGDYLSKIIVREYVGTPLFEINFRPEGDETRVWITCPTEPLLSEILEKE